MIPKITNVEVVENYKIRLNYETGEIKLFDVLPYIAGTWYKELYDDRYFKKVHIISNGKGIEWEHGQDIAPHELYDMSISVNGNI
jgi:hypothetical protein